MIVEKVTFHDSAISRIFLYIGVEQDNIPGFTAKGLLLHCREK